LLFLIQPMDIEGMLNELTFILLMWRIGRAPNSIPIYSYIHQDATLHSIYIWKLLYMFRVVLSPIIRSVYNCIYSICYLSHRYCYLPLSWKSWNRFECAVGGAPPQLGNMETRIINSSVISRSSNRFPKYCRLSERWNRFLNNTRQISVFCTFLSPHK
jgi:hypothetical protein